MRPLRLEPVEEQALSSSFYISSTWKGAKLWGHWVLGVCFPSWLLLLRHQRFQQQCKVPDWSNLWNIGKYSQEGIQRKGTFIYSLYTGFFFAKEPQTSPSQCFHITSTSPSSLKENAAKNAEGMFHLANYSCNWLLIVYLHPKSVWL